MLLKLTPRGAEVIDRARAVSRALNEDTLEGAGDEACLAAIRLLQHVLKRMCPGTTRRFVNNGFQAIRYLNDARASDDAAAFPILDLLFPQPVRTGAVDQPDD